jgi:hypothetical protein
MLVWDSVVSQDGGTIRDWWVPTYGPPESYATNPPPLAKAGGPGINPYLVYNDERVPIVKLEATKQYRRSCFCQATANALSYYYYLYSGGSIQDWNARVIVACYACKDAANFESGRAAGSCIEPDRIDMWNDNGEWPGIDVYKVLVEAGKGSVPAIKGCTREAYAILGGEFKCYPADIANCLHVGWNQGAIAGLHSIADRLAATGDVALQDRVDNNKAIMSAVESNGAVIAHMFVSEAFYQYHDISPYTGEAVFTRGTAGPLIAADGTVPSDRTYKSHWVCICGWGGAHTSTPYWIVRNSWGYTDWGLFTDGYSVKTPGGAGNMSPGFAKIEFDALDIGMEVLWVVYDQLPTWSALLMGP